MRTRAINKYLCAMINTITAWNVAVSAKRLRNLHCESCNRTVHSSP